MHTSLSPSSALQIDPADNVLVALRDLAPGDVVNEITVTEAIPAGHKIARESLAVGDVVTKYGYPIGQACQAIAVGSHVHIHNVKSALAEKLEDLKFTQARPTRAPVPVAPRWFSGYRRADGRAATRNEIWIVNTVGCINQAVTRIAQRAQVEFADAGLDGIFAFPHPFGCSQLGDDLKATQAVLAGLVNHPNAGAVLVLGLGCENNQLDEFLKIVGPQPLGRIRYFDAQKVENEVEAGLTALRELVAYAVQFKRQPIPAAELIIGMKCGGSDGFSGITANPLVGRIADRAAAGGGTVLLTEVPEMFGAERVLLERTKDETTFRGVVELVNRFRAYFTKHHEPIDENPSPGNKAGGITTLAEKSLGCVQKGGKAPVCETLAYGARARPGLGGLALLNGPGNDGVSGTAMTVAGAHLLLFTTGRGNPLGFPIPTLKISSNSALARSKPQWIDFDAGPVATSAEQPTHLADQLWTLVLDIASGRTLARNEVHGYREIAIWKDGVTL